jgi:hypothetical protein
MANIPELERVLQYIKDHPEEHDQHSWAHRGPSCGTTMCFAGTAVQLSGKYQLEWSATEGAAYARANNATDARGRSWFIPDAAEELLGLTARESHALFLAATNIDELELMVKNLANGDHARTGLIELREAKRRRSDG